MFLAWKLPALLETLRAEPICARAVVVIDRLTERPKSSERSATLVLLARTVELAPTGRENRATNSLMRLQGVLVEEKRALEGVDPIRWVLLTTLAVDTPEACRTVVQYYARRWRVKD